MIQDPLSYKLRDMGAEEKNIGSDYSFARPSFWSGVARLLDLWGKFDEYNSSLSTDEDGRALYSDWRVTGQDLRDSLLSYGNEKTESEVAKRTTSKEVVNGGRKTWLHHLRAANR
jgi:hypothetical protein